MLDKKTMPTEEFIKFFRGILAKTEEARTKMDNLIKSVIEDIENYQAHLKYEEDMKKYEEDMKKYEKDMEEYNKKKLNMMKK
jgi:Na+/phosphate symporter